MVPFAPKGDQRTRTATEDELAKLYAAAPPHMRFALICWTHLGMRKSEALKPTPKDLNPINHTITTTTKGGHIRAYPMTRELEAIIESLYPIPDANMDTPLYLLLRQTPRYRGSKIQHIKECARKDWAKLLTETGTPEDLHIHDLRRTGATGVHRLHLAVSEQRKTLERHAATKKQAHRKPVAARSAPSMTHSTTRKRERGSAYAATIWILLAAMIGTMLAAAVPQGDKPTLISGANSNNGQPVPLAVDAAGVLSTELVPSSLSFEPGAFKSFAGAAAPLWVTNSAEFTHITDTAAHAVRNNEGQLDSILVNTAAAGTISVFDLASASCTGTPSTNVVAVITEAATPTTDEIVFHAHLHNGICVQASAAMDLTVTHQ